jgi:hypothetical protein
MAYHSNENDFVDNQRRREEQHPSSNSVERSRRERQDHERDWEQRLTNSSLLANLVRLAERCGVRFRKLPDQPICYQFRRDGASLVLKPTATGITAVMKTSWNASVTEKVVDLRAPAKQVFQECFRNIDDDSA